MSVPTEPVTLGLDVDGTIFRRDEALARPAAVRLANESARARAHHLRRARDVCRHLVEVLELEDEPLARAARGLWADIETAIVETEQGAPEAPIAL
jgi:hypothetical protein